MCMINKAEIPESATSRAFCLGKGGELRGEYSGAAAPPHVTISLSAAVWTFDMALRTVNWL